MFWRNFGRALWVVLFIAVILVVFIGVNGGEKKESSGAKPVVPAGQQPGNKQFF